jgi:hypothetical protein
MLTRLSYSPSECPIDTDVLLRQHGRIDDASFAGLLESYALVATELVEQYLGRFLLSRAVTWTAASGKPKESPLSGSAFKNSYNFFYTWLGQLRGWVELPRPASAVVSGKYVTWDGEEVELVEGDDFNTDLKSEPARLRFLNVQPLSMQIAHMEVEFTSGYGATPDAIPMPIKHALLLIVTNLYENRGDTAFGIWTDAVEALLAPYRIQTFG